MSIQYTKTPTGLFVELKGTNGSIQATVHRPEHKRSGRKEWRLCFATCTGEAYGLQGKVQDFNKLATLKHELKRNDALMNASLGVPFSEARGMPLKEMVHA